MGSSSSPHFPLVSNFFIFYCALFVIHRTSLSEWIVQDEKSVWGERDKEIAEYARSSRGQSLFGPSRRVLKICLHQNTSGIRTRPVRAWRPSESEILFHDRSSFCTLFDKQWRDLRSDARGILFVGDSIMQEVAGLFGYYLRVHGTKSTRMMASGFVQCSHKKTVKFQYIQNDMLLTQTAYPFGNDSMEGPQRPLCGYQERSNVNFYRPKCEVWARSDILQGFSVIVLGTVAHYSSLSNGSIHRGRLAHNMERVAIQIERANPHAVVLYLDAIPPIADCSNISAPFASLQEAERKTVEHPFISIHTVRFFYEANLVMQAVFKKYKMFYRVPLYEPLILRGDVHVGGADCYHRCGPPYDTLTLTYDLIIETLKLALVASELNIISNKHREE
jgi:hypothetical protein